MWELIIMTFTMNRTMYVLLLVSLTSSVEASEKNEVPNPSLSVSSANMSDPKQTHMV